MKRKSPKSLRRFPKQYAIGPDHDLIHEYSVRIGTRVRQERVRRGLSQKTLASKVGIAQTVISYLESGWANPTLLNLLKLADFFDMDVSEIFFKKRSHAFHV